MGGLFKPKTPSLDKSALRAAEEQRRKSKQEAEAAQVKQDAVEDANRQRKKNVSASGRASTILAGEDSNSLLGS